MTRRSRWIERDPGAGWLGLIALDNLG